jgi:2'-hydroxyisoflavone reductase
MSRSRRDVSRRDVLRGGLAAAAFGVVQSACSRSQSGGGKKRILILGGTGFIGPKTIDAAVARGHHVTIFNRGKREKFLPLQHQVEHLYGNRDPLLPADDEKGPDGKLLHPDASPKGLEQLAGKSWDAVIDNSGFFPRMVEASAQLLAKNVGRYIYISSISAYDEKSTPPQGGDETVKLAELADPKVETMGKEFENYGGLKVLCERAVAAAFPQRCAIVRPGYIVGPGDPTDRFTYWPMRIKKGGEVLAPGSPDDPLQWIDVRDLADWLIMLVENQTVGSFNAVGPTPPARWGDVLRACTEAANSDAKLEWVPADWLAQNGAGGEDAFPIWIAPVGKYAGFHRWNNGRAMQAGLKLRDPRDTAKAILDWAPGEVERRTKVANELKAKEGPPRGPDPNLLRAGPPPEREQELLAKWKASRR